MSRKIIGVTVGTPISPEKLKEKLDITEHVERVEAAATRAETFAQEVEADRAEVSDNKKTVQTHVITTKSYATGAQNFANKAEEAATRAEEAVANIPEYGVGTVKSVNGIEPDESGNVEITIPESGGNVDLTGVVKSVNGQNPDENGNVEIEIPDAVAVDTTLTKSGEAADAKVMGDKTNWYVTPEMYGAVGDGVADDTHPVTKALNSGKLVYFGYKRTYLITSSIRVATGYRTFIGNNSTIKLAEGVDDNVLTLSEGVRNLTIERLTLRGNKANQNGLYFDGNVVGCRFYQVCFRQNGKSGIKVTTVTYANQIVECEFDENGEHGFDGVTEDTTKHCVSTTDFNLCRFTKNGISGLNINGSTNKVFGGWFEGNDVGIIFSAEHYSTGSTGLFGVDIEGNKSHGIKFLVADGKTMDSIQIIGGQLCGSTTNVSVLHFDIPRYKNIINITIDSRVDAISGIAIDAVNPAFIYAKQFPVEKLPSGTKLRVFVGINDQYLTDADIQRYIVGAKPTFVDAYKQCSYALSPGECVTVRFDTPAYCAKVKCTSDSTIQLISTIIVSGKFVQNVSPAPTVTDGVHEFSLNTDTPFIMLKNTGTAETVISNILFTGRLPVL